jgi:hypothetical protein
MDECDLSSAVCCLKYSLTQNILDLLPLDAKGDDGEEVMEFAIRDNV